MQLVGRLKIVILSVIDSCEFYFQASLFHTLVIHYSIYRLYGRFIRPLSLL